MPAPTLTSGPAPELLQTLFDVSLTGVILFRPVYEPGAGAAITDLAYVRLNPAAQRMLQLPEVPEHTFLTLYPRASETGIFAFYRDTFLSGQAGRYDVNYQHDGLDNYFHLAAQRAGELLVVSFTDTSDHDRSAAEQALRESQAREKAARATAESQQKRLREVLMELPALIACFTGPSHIYDFVNPSYQQLFPDRMLLGNPLREALPELVRQNFLELFDEVYRTGVPFYGTELEARGDYHGEGYLTYRYFNVYLQALRDEQGRINGLLNFGYDVTEQVRARHKSTEAQQQVLILNEELSATNEELMASNEEIQANNAELLHSQQQLNLLNQELESRVLQRTLALLRAQNEAERQRARLENFFMQAPASICILDGPELVFELVNPAYQQLFPGRRLLGLPLLEALPELRGHQVWHTLQQVYRTGHTHEETGLLIPVAPYEGGPLHDFYFNYIQQARTNEDGQVDGVLVFAFEVTEQVKARHAAEASAWQLRVVTDALPVLIGYIDHEGRYRFANKAYESWFNQKPEQLLGREVREVIGEEAFSQVQHYFNRALAGEALQFSARMPYREDFVRYIHTSYVPDLRDGEVAGFFTLVTDVTEQELARQQVQDLNDELRARNDELHATNHQLRHINIDLDNFIYAASHDLKSPITNIEGLLQVLQEHLPPGSPQHPDVAPILAMMQDSVLRFKRTIDDLSDVTKLQKEHDLPSTDVALADVVEDVRLDLQPLLSQTGGQLLLELQDCPSVSFSTKNLRSVVYNLLSNALKFRHAERVPLVRISCRQVDGFTVLSVQDNGLGLEQSQQAELFTMFRRLHTHVDGTGIGLYMVKRSVENAGGHVEVESVPGVGSTFSVFFKRG
ncbi:hypothetical protein GCM10023185_34020 [Hymenobacter saemangeumensis]|uniref:histidine kinase n=1 Tax=Hymenobacter saemangeumensis TaxID=1084522 RepID=A0ABP8INP3_9BACT